MTLQFNEKNYTRTADLALATAVSLFYPLESIERGGRKAQFVFKRDVGLDDLIANYWRRELKVEPTAYFEALRLIKARLYENQ